MAKKLKKNTTIAKAKSLKTNVTRKFKAGGPVDFELQDLIDPEKPTAMQPIGMKPIVDSTPPVELEAQYKQYPYQNPGKTQFFPSHYLANADAYNKADSEGRTMGIDWYEKRKQLPQFKDASESFIKTFKEGAPAYYYPDEAYEKTKTFKNSVAMALMPYYPTEDDNVTTTPNSQPTFQDKINEILKTNPNASFQYTGRRNRVRNEKGEKENLYGNSVNYKGHSGAEPFTTFEELNHVASNTAGGTNTGHKEAMEKLGQIVDENTMLNAGYTDIPDYKEYANYASGDQEEFFTSLQTARQSLGLDPLKEDYTEDQMLELLEKKRAEGEAGLINKESAESDQMSRFYRTIGWPTTNSKYLNGRKPSELTGDELEQYNQAKKDAAKRFLQSHNSVAENEGGNTEDYGLPLAARYGGYQTYKTGGIDKKDPLKKATIATAADSSSVANGADIANNYYLNNGYTVRPNTPSRGGYTEPFARLAEARKDYNYGTNIDIITGRQIPYSDYTTYKRGKPQFEQREVTIGIINKSAPKSKYDTRIKPQKLVTYHKNFTKNEAKSGFTGDTAEVPVYDRVATTPWKDLTDDEKIERLENFGASGTPYKAADIQQAIQDIEKNRKPMEPIGMKPIEVKSAPVKIERQLPEDNYTLHHTGNGGGIAYLHKTVRDKNGNIIQSGNMGIVLTKDFLTPEQEKEFDNPSGGTARVQFNPNAQIFHTIQEPFDIIKEQRGTRQKAENMQKKAQTEVEAEKTAYEQYQQQLRDKEKARLKKTQDEIEADKAANQKAMGGFGDPEDPEKPWRHKTKSKDGNYLYNRVGTNAIQDYDKSTVRRTLKGFITGAPKPKKTVPIVSDAKFAEGGMNKNMLNANSTTGPRSEQSWQDPGVDRFSGNTNGINADYYFKKGGLKSKVSSKFAKLKL
jgi:hypothetical protein